MKHCRTFAFFLSWIVLVCFTVSAQANTAADQPTNGRVDGSVYRNAYFGFNYFIPESWAARGAPGKLPGAPDGHLLLTLKRAGGQDQLSSVMVSAAELVPYGGDLSRYLDERYHLSAADSGASETTINGISVGRGKRVHAAPELLMMADRAFYRIDIERSGITRVVMATEQQGYALVFELLVPSRRTEASVTEFVDSLHGLSFSAPPKAAKTQQK